MLIAQLPVYNKQVQYVQVLFQCDWISLLCFSKTLLDCEPITR